MNDLFSDSLSRLRDEQEEEPEHEHLIEINDEADEAKANLNKFFEDVESIKVELNELHNIYERLRNHNERSRTLHTAKSVQVLRNDTDFELGLALGKVKLVGIQLRALDRDNDVSRTVTGCGKGTPSDRTRTSIVDGLRRNLESEMLKFDKLREQISSEYCETVRRRYFTVTGEDPDEKTIEDLISTGASETMLRKAIYGESVRDTISEVHERYEGLKEMEKSLKELHQVFLDMAVIVDTQGERIDDIEKHVAKSHSFVSAGTEKLRVSWMYRNNTKKWICYGVVIVVVLVVLVVVLSVVITSTTTSGVSDNRLPPLSFPDAINYVSLL